MAAKLWTTGQVAASRLGKISKLGNAQAHPDALQLAGEIRQLASAGDSRGFTCVDETSDSSIGCSPEPTAGACAECFDLAEPEANPAKQVESLDLAMRLGGIEKRLEHIERYLTSVPFCIASVPNGAACPANTAP